jgi:hypothetical protein
MMAGANATQVGSRMSMAFVNVGQRPIGNGAAGSIVGMTVGFVLSVGAGAVFFAVMAMGNNKTNSFPMMVMGEESQCQYKEIDRQNTQCADNALEHILFILSGAKL